MITLLKIVEDQFDQKASIRKESDIEKAIDGLMINMCK